MPVPTRTEILRLYKNLLRYGQELKYTDKKYFYNRIRNEFLNQKQAESHEIEHLYNRVKFVEIKKSSLMLSKMMLGNFSSTFNMRALVHRQFIKEVYHSIRLKWTIDKSKVPELDENDLRETFVKGSGPGGSRVNKSANCVCLKHLKTGIVVKCHEDRSLERNRKIARERMIMKLDDLYNGEDSVNNQKKRIEQQKRKERERKRKKLLALRAQYKNINHQDENSGV